MKSRETAMRLKRREEEEKSRKVKNLQRIIREFDQAAADLERQIQIEEDRTGIRDQSHISYSTFAKAAAERRDNLRQSAEWLAKSSLPLSATATIQRSSSPLPHSRQSAATYR